jgi:hypothetical protein
MSRGFLCTLIGIVLTVVARIGSWYWPGWPARTVLDFVLARWAPTVVSGPGKALGLLALMLINIGFWAGLAWLAVASIAAARRRLCGRGMREE